MKSPGGGSSGGAFPSGPTLTPKQKATRDRKEAAKARKESAHARDEAGRARGEAAKARGEARHERSLASKDTREGFKAEAAKDDARAARDDARARRDDARARRDVVRSSRDAARGRRDVGRARTAGLARPVRPGEWILGGNDRYLSCAAAAVANSLLAATGWRASDDDVIGLHFAAGGADDTGVSIADVLAAAAAGGLGGWHPVCEGPADVLVAELELAGGVHAAAVTGGHVITWGHAIPAVSLDWPVTAAWAITWR